MEQRFDNLIDNLFSGMGSVLMVLNGALGIGLIITGVILIKKKSRKKTAGIICIGLGVLAIISGIVQNSVIIS